MDKDYYDPKYSSIADFNEKYAGTGLENYLWYHSSFYSLVKGLYECEGKGFLSGFETAFPKGSASQFTSAEIIDVLDEKCKGAVRQRATEPEARTRK